MANKISLWKQIRFAKLKFTFAQDAILRICLRHLSFISILYYFYFFQTPSPAPRSLGPHSRVFLKGDSLLILKLENIERTHRRKQTRFDLILFRKRPRFHLDHMLCSDSLLMTQLYMLLFTELCWDIVAFGFENHSILQMTFSL